MMPRAVGAERPSGGIRPLAGIRVTDLTSMLAGPYCSRWLADLGAEVIKVESPDGDYMRNTAPRRGKTSAYFSELNAGKKSLAIDMKSPDGLRAVRDLVLSSDVLLENFRPGVMARLGLDYEALRDEKPTLIYCAISGYGQTGPGASLPAYAAIVHASCGFDLTAMESEENAQVPQTCGIQIADVLAASFACSAIQAALLQRARTGRGQAIDLALFDSMITLLPSQFQQSQIPESIERRPRYRPLRTADGFVAVMPLSQANFAAMCRAIGDPGRASDPRFATPGERLRNWSALLELVEAWTQCRSSRECEETFAALGVPAAAHRTLGEAIASPQVAHRALLHESCDEAGPLKVVGLPYSLSEADVSPGPRVPSLGEHSVEILSEVLGYGPGDVATLVESGTIRQAARPRTPA